MNLQIWFPLNGNLNNQGLNNSIKLTNDNSDIELNGKIGSCYSFNGSSSRLYSEQQLNYTTKNLSFCVWAKIDSTVTHNAYLGGLSLASSPGFMLYYAYSSQKLYGYINGTTRITYQLSEQLHLNTWHHYTMTYNGTKVFLYIDGAFITSADYSTETGIGNCYVNIGSRRSNSTTGAYFFQGLLNDFRIYDYCLSPKEVEEITKGLIAHYKLDNNGMGNENLAANTGNELIFSTSSDWTYMRPPTGIANRAINNTEHGVDIIHNSTTNDLFTVSFDYSITGVDTTFTLKPWLSKSSSSYDYNGNWVKTIGNSIPVGNSSGRFIGVMKLTADQISYGERWIMGSLNKNNNRNIQLLISNFKFEKGSEPTIWSPAPSDADYPSDYKTTIFDSSGYGNDGTVIGSLTTATGSPRYEVGTIFNGTDAAIKVINNNWCSQGMEALTINLWVKASAWSGNIRLFSCTESGGFNTESGNSGYLRFPVNVYTNAEKTTSAYKYDGNELQRSALPVNEWIMLTFVYDTTGTKTYINGELHHTYSNTSYGIHFNTNARLFLGCEASAANPSTPYLNGQESDFRIYATALSAAAIKELYNTGGAIDSSGNIYARELVEV